MQEIKRYEWTKSVREDSEKSVQLSRLGRRKYWLRDSFSLTDCILAACPLLALSPPPPQPSLAAWPENGLQLEDWRLWDSVWDTVESVCTHLFYFSDLFCSGSSCSIFMESVSVLCSPDQKRWSLLYPLAMLLCYMRVNLPSYWAFRHEDLLSGSANGYLTHSLCLHRCSVQTLQSERVRY